MPRPVNFTLGVSMKKIVVALVFTGLGLFATWSALRLVDQVDWSRFTYIRPSGCWEIDHCDVPWYFVSLFFFVLLLPTFVHMVAGWRLSTSSPRKVVVSAAVLWVATLAFYSLSRIASGK